jgi:small subunit ribosomal protein S20
VLRAQRNRSIKSAVKTKVTKFRRGVAEGVEGVEEFADIAVSALDRAAAKGVLHRNNVARRKSRLMRRLSAARQASEATPAPEAPAAGAARGSRSRASTRR